MRISDARRRSSPFVFVASAVLLAACSEAPTNTQVLAQAEATQAVEAADDGRIQCALDEAEAFARVCTLDREQTAAGLVLTARHPDGGFHRLLVTKDGRGVVAADGAEAAVVTIVGRDEIEVALGGDHYRLPATVRAGSAQTP